MSLELLLSRLLEPKSHEVILLHKHGKALWYRLLFSAYALKYSVVFHYFLLINLSFSWSFLIVKLNRKVNALRIKIFAVIATGSCFYHREASANENKQLWSDSNGIFDR